MAPSGAGEHSGSACRSCASRAGSCSRAPAVHQGDNLLETGKERAVKRSSGCGEVILAPGNIRKLRAAPCRVQVKHVIAARPVMQRITAMRRVRRGSRSDPRAAAGTPGQAHGQRVSPSYNRPPPRAGGGCGAYRPGGCARYAARSSSHGRRSSRQKVWEYLGMVHCFGSCCGG